MYIRAHCPYLSALTIESVTLSFESSFDSGLLILCVFQVVVARQYTRAYTTALPELMFYIDYFVVVNCRLAILMFLRLSSLIFFLLIFVDDLNLLICYLTLFSVISAVIRFSY